MLKTTLLATTVAFFAVPALAESLMIKDAYARSSRPNAPVGAAFMQIMNHSDADDRLVSVSSDVANRVELHTHRDLGDGVMQMTEVENGFVIPAGGMHTLARGGDHVMFMGLTDSLEQGSTISVTLTFEKAGDMELEIPVDNERMGAHGHGNGHKHDDDNS